ncbi:MAG: Ig-like domain-containing protein [Chloroflexota bacterium]|nr:Ig-like domain-containing protein [Chloroflexota bacterium]
MQNYFANEIEAAHQRLEWQRAHARAAQVALISPGRERTRWSDRAHRIMARLRANRPGERRGLVPAHGSSVKQSVCLAGLALAMVVAGLGPLLDGQEVEARKRGRNAAARGGVTAELIQGFSNPATVSLGSGGTTTIDVSGFDQPLADVNVTLRNMTQSSLGDLNVLLVGPAGQTAVIFSDIGSNSSANNLTVTLDDQAATQIPVGPIQNGVYQPTNVISNDIWPAPPAPAHNLPSGAQLSVFNGTDPNGTWRLVFHNDNLASTAGALVGGWSLEITSANGVPTAAPDTLQAQAGKAVSGPSVLGNDTDPDNDALTAILASQPRQGSVSMQPDGAFTYKAKKKAKGSDRFTYLAQDPSGLSDLETVTIQVKKARKNKKKGKR